MAIYDDYVWRLYSESPYEEHEVVLPKDLDWIDEFTWNPISQEVKNTLTGSIVVSEYEQLVGRQITFNGKDDMCWIQRPLVDELIAMRNIAGLNMTLEFVSASFDDDIDVWSFGNVYKSFNTMFRQSEVPLEFGGVKGFDNFEQDSWFKIVSIKLMDIGNSDPTDPCT